MWKKERAHGSLTRKVQLPSKADLKGAIKANYENGVLCICVPKMEEKQAAEHAGAPIQIQ